jgi:2-polyprenyl-6-methoxyphenol hydroxylase-like FAD-dependent oxidoreductase
VRPQRVLVIGGGIAGLAAARALLQRGLEADVVERAASWSPGTGMYLPANSVGALATLGLEAALHDRAYEIRHQVFLDQRGRVLLNVDLRDVWGAIGPCVAISHRALHELLREGIAVRLGTTVTALDDQGSSVRATFVDASTVVYDVVVGADGVHSLVRSALFGGADATFVGQASWRFLADGFPGDLRLDGAAWSRKSIPHASARRWPDLLLRGRQRRAPRRSDGRRSGQARGRPLEEFEARRRPRVAFVQAQTHRRDRTRNLPPFLRRTTLRLAGQRIYRANYKPLLTPP